MGVFVHPDYRGAHLEAELLSWAEQQVREQATVAQRVVPAIALATAPVLSGTAAS